VGLGKIRLEGNRSLQNLDCLLVLIMIVKVLTLIEEGFCLLRA